MTPERRNVNTFKGDRLRAIRKEKGLTQPQLAKGIGYNHYQNIAHFEKGRQRPSVAAETKLCKFFGVEGNYFRD